MKRFLCIHGHFYQPPRENPWIEEVELQDSAHPYHDWNERIMAECYAPNSVSRIMGSDNKIISVSNNYSNISFNFGPTLMTWLEKNAPDTYEAVLTADRESMKKFSGHGSAIAQCYNHMIMPLANVRDKLTQILWGIRDFEHRFKRKPEGMWLPETAVDLETLDILAQLGIKFTILAPSQAKCVRKIGNEKWEDAGGSKIDPKIPYICNLPSGNRIVLFFYDGPVSQELAFSKLLENGENFANRLVSLFSSGQNPQLVHISTDGETYGHHHLFGDMALAYCLYRIESENLAKLTIYGEYLDANPPKDEVEIHENSSWSCVHGVERWRSDCGCNSGTRRGWNQKWRTPLRGALDFLRDNVSQIFEEHARNILSDPWKARDEYIEIILDRSNGRVDEFLKRHSGRELDETEKVKALKLLEMQRHSMLMYTSCAWFFDEISGIETVQVMNYAARVIQLAQEVSGISFEESFTGLLAQAPSNIPEFADGKHIYETFVKPSVIDTLRVGVHYAVSSLFTDYSKKESIFNYEFKQDMFDETVSGKQKLIIGKISLKSKITLEKSDISFVVLHMGDHNIICGARYFTGESGFAEMNSSIKESFQKNEISGLLKQINDHFPDKTYSLWHLFRDEQRRFLNKILKDVNKDAETSFRQLFERHYPVMKVVEDVRMPLPTYFSAIADYTINTEIARIIETGEPEKEVFGRIPELVKSWPVNLNRDDLAYIAAKRINGFMEEFGNLPHDRRKIRNTIEMLNALKNLDLDLNLWHAQNIYFLVGKPEMEKMKEKKASNDPEASEWLGDFRALGELLRIRLD
ncbi:MAG: DUF3536 domain-containing protein [Endomicrobiales bacterium]|nr:DUF3536 domain-containing protein [Endomicrobiales bacterium]